MIKQPGQALSLPATPLQHPWIFTLTRSHHIRISGYTGLWYYWSAGHLQLGKDAAQLALQAVRALFSKLSVLPRCIVLQLQLVHIPLCCRAVQVALPQGSLQTALLSRCLHDPTCMCYVAFAHDS